MKQKRNRAQRVPFDHVGMWRVILVLAMVIALVAVETTGLSLADEETEIQPGAEVGTTSADPGEQPTGTEIATETPEPVLTETPITTVEDPATMPADTQEPTETPASVDLEPTESSSAEPPAEVLTETPTSEVMPAADARDDDETSAPGSEPQAKKELKLTVSSKGTDFGDVTPDGMLSGGARGLYSMRVDDGADYVIPAAVTLNVKSDTAWTITSSIADLGSWGGGLTGSLSWRVSGEGAWQPMLDGEVILSGSAGTTTIEIDLRLHVSWTSGAGTLNVVITFQAVALPET